MMERRAFLSFTPGRPAAVATVAVVAVPVVGVAATLAGPQFAFVPDHLGADDAARMNHDSFRRTA